VVPQHVTWAVRHPRPSHNGAAGATDLEQEVSFAPPNFGQSRVIYPSFQQGIARERADKYLGGRFDGIVGFELAGGLEAGKRFINALKLLYHVSNLGGTRSLALHPAPTIHSQLTPEERTASGATDGYVRLSVGLEHIDDILADLSQALHNAGTTRAAA
jgi:O-acetylhomoserine (thiol)-lyase